MSMSTEEALNYMKKEEPKVEETKVEEPKQEAQEPETPSVEGTKSEETNVDSPEDAKKDDGEQPEAKTVESDESKDDKPKDAKKKEMSQQDYAFMKQKDKNRKLQDKYDKLNTKFNETNKQKDARIKELEEQLKKYEPLQAKDFQKQDGSMDIDAYTDWKLKQRDMQNEVSNLRQSMQQDKLQQAIEYDRYVTERCFSGKELEEYDNLMSTNGQIFAQEVHKVDPNNVVFNYLESISDYPIVLRELMVHPERWLGQMFRSKDPDILKFNTAKIADQILEEHYRKPATPEVQNTQPVQNAKPAMPVIGKQITNAGATSPEQVSLLDSMASINNYLRKANRRR